MAGGQNWWVTSAPISMPGGTTVGGGGYGTAVITYRNPLDARRSMAGQESQYPDGYLGTIVDRQEDRLLGAVQQRLTERSYQRGVHVGSKIGRDQYYWTQQINPAAGLRRQAHAVQDGNVLVVPRCVPAGAPAERLSHLGKTAGLTRPETLGLARQYGVQVPGGPSPSQLAKLLPPWAM